MTGDRFTIGDIPTGAAVYRWLVFGLERPEMPHIAAGRHGLLGARASRCTSFTSRADADGVRVSGRRDRSQSRAVGLTVIPDLMRTICPVPRARRTRTRSDCPSGSWPRW